MLQRLRGHNARKFAKYCLSKLSPGLKPPRFHGHEPLNCARFLFYWFWKCFLIKLFFRAYWSFGVFCAFVWCCNDYAATIRENPEIFLFIEFSTPSLFSRTLTNTTMISWPRTPKLWKIFVLLILKMPLLKCKFRLFCKRSSGRKKARLHDGKFAMATIRDILQKFILTFF